MWPVDIKRLRITELNAQLRVAEVASRDVIIMIQCHIAHVSIVTVETVEIFQCMQLPGHSAF